MKLADVRDGLVRWAAARTDPPATVLDIRALPGHAGLSYAFSLGRSDSTERLVVRLAPPGVARRANNDVLRQVPLLGALAEAGVPVPTVRSFGSEPELFGTDYVIVDFLPGSVRSTDGFSDEAPPQLVHHVAAASSLGRIHARVDVGALGEDWLPRSLVDEITSWDRAIERSDPAVAPALRMVRTSLLESAPAMTPIGLLHGDYQFSNLLFVDDRLSAVLDWELAGIGPQLLDLGWLLAITDERNWAHPIPARPSGAAESMVAAYRDSSDLDVDDGDVAYFEALACWRFAVIAGLNLSLHRSGKRVDDHWERIAPSVPVLLRTARRRLDMRQGPSSSNPSSSNG